MLDSAKPQAALMVLMSFMMMAAAAGAQPVSEQNLRRTYVVQVFQANRDAVVNVNTTQVVRQRVGGMLDDPFFRRFFNFPDQHREIKRTSLGSGFIIHADGYIVTNAHVVDGADEIDVILASGRHLPAKVLASDATHDIAVLRVEPPADIKLAVIELGDSSDLMIGEPVVAIGNPMGYEHTVTSGIVSATNRTLTVTSDWKLEGLIQTDASINPGNSGGPLLNAYGQLIGINSAIRGDAQNIGFAIPVSHLRSLLPELLSPVQLSGMTLGGRLSEVVKIEEPAKVVSSLRWIADDGSTPELVVRRINGRQVETIVDGCVEMLRGCTAGRPIVLEGDGGRVAISPKPAPLSDGQRLARAMIGVRVRAIAGVEAQRRGINRGGLLVEQVERGSPAEQAGLRIGDVLVHLGRFRITKLEDLAAVLTQARGGMAADVYVVRDGQMGRARLQLRGPNGGAL